jgi:hypothetical protein
MNCPKPLLYPKRKKTRISKQIPDEGVVVV